MSPIQFSSAASSTPDVHASASVPWGCLVCPMTQLRSLKRSVLPAADVPRCGGCYAYVNRFCRFQYREWVCSLCSRSNPMRGVRYGSNRAREACAELSSSFVEFSDVAPRNPREAALRARFAYVAVVDLAADAAELEAVKEALAAAVERLDARTCFGLVAFAERVGIYDLASEFPHVLRRRPGDGGLDVRRALPASSRPLVPLGPAGSAARAAVAAAIGSLASRRGGCRCFGDAAGAALEMLELPRGERRGELGSARLACFVTGATTSGSGAVGERRGEALRSALIERSVELSDAEELLLEEELVAPDPVSVDFWRGLADAAADAGICIDLHALCDESVGAFTDLATLRVLPSATGGRLRRYAHDSGPVLLADLARRLRGDLCRQIACRERAVHGMLRLRCSSGLGLDAVGGSGSEGSASLRYVLGPGTASPEHPDTEGLWTLAAADEHTTLGFTFAFKSVAAGRSGFENAPLVQLAFSFARPFTARRSLRVYTVRMVLGSTAPDVLRSVHAPSLIALLAREAVATALLGHGRMNDVRLMLHEWCLSFLDAAERGCAMSRKSDSGGGSGDDAMRWLRSNLAHFDRLTLEGEEEEEGGDNDDAAAGAGGIGSELGMARIPLLLYALLWHPALARGGSGSSGGGVGRAIPPDARVAMATLVESLSPSALCRLLVPTLRAYATADASHAASHEVAPLTKRAVAASAAHVCVLQSLDTIIVYFSMRALHAHIGAAAALAASSPIAMLCEAAVDAEGGDVLTPRMLHASEGRASAGLRSFDLALIEDGGEGGTSFAQFEADLCEQFEQFA